MCARDVQVRRMLQECGNNKKLGVWEKRWSKAQQAVTMPTIWDVSPPCDGAKMMDDQIPPRFPPVEGGRGPLPGLVSRRSLEGEGGRGWWVNRRRKSLVNHRNAAHARLLRRY